MKRTRVYLYRRPLAWFSLCWLKDDTTFSVIVSSSILATFTDDPLTLSVSCSPFNHSYSTYDFTVFLTPLCWLSSLPTQSFFSLINSFLQTLYFSSGSLTSSSTSFTALLVSSTRWFTFPLCFFLAHWLALRAHSSPRIDRRGIVGREGVQGQDGKVFFHV